MTFCYSFHFGFNLVALSEEVQSLYFVLIDTSRWGHNIAKLSHQFPLLQKVETSFLRKWIVPGCEDWFGVVCGGWDGEEEAHSYRKKHVQFLSCCVKWQQAAQEEMSDVRLHLWRDWGGLEVETDVNWNILVAECLPRD